MREYARYLFELLCELIIKKRKKKSENSVTSVPCFLNRVDIPLTSHFFVATRLSLTCFDKDIYFYTDAFFLYIYFLFT